jgi:hypothetical protein
MFIAVKFVITSGFSGCFETICGGILIFQIDVNVENSFTYFEI